MNKFFTKYDPETGEIISVFSALEGEQWVNSPNVEGRYSAKEYRIVDGVPVKKSEEEVTEVEIERAWLDLREIRQGLLQASDWTQTPDAPVDIAAWAVYRKALRDLPANTSDPRYPDWPTPP